MTLKSGKLAIRTPPRRVVVALRMAGIAGQDKLNGIFDYLSAGRRWQLIIYRTTHEFTADVVKHELARGTDGFIAGIPGADDAQNGRLRSFHVKKGICESCTDSSY